MVKLIKDTDKNCQVALKNLSVFSTFPAGKLYFTFRKNWHGIFI